MSRFPQGSGDDLGHAEEGLVLDALGGADDDLAGVEMGAQRAKVERRNSEGMTERTISASRHGGVVAGDGDLWRDGKAGEKEDVLAGVVDLLGELRAMRPERDLVAAAAVEREGECGTPGAGTEDDNAAHAGLFFARSGIPCRPSDGGCSGGA